MIAVVIQTTGTIATILRGKIRSGRQTGDGRGMKNKGGDKIGVVKTTIVATKNGGTTTRTTAIVEARTGKGYWEQL
jgi:hypothetical protein